MKLMTKELEKRFREIGSQEYDKDPIVVAEYFNRVGAGYWYATEYDPERKVFFGYVSIFGDHKDEFGSFSLEELELENLKARFYYIGEVRLSELADTFKP